MTQIVRKFILLSIMITILATCIVIVYNRLNIVEPFGIRDINGRRNRALRRCIGTSTPENISKNKECSLEGFENEYIDGIIGGIGNVVDSTNNIDKIFSHILNQIPNWIKDNSTVEEVFNKPSIELQFKDINLDTKHIKFKNPLPLHEYKRKLVKILENDLPQLSRSYNNMNQQEKENIKKMLLNNALIAFKVNVKDDSVLVLPKQDFSKKNITLPFENNENILLHVNTNNSDTKSNKFKLHNITIEKTMDDIDIKYVDISVDIGTYNLGNQSKFIKFKNIKIIDN